MPSKSNTWFIAVFLTAVFSCKKEIETEVPKIDLLTNHKWQLTNLYHQESGDKTISNFTSIYYKSCEMDDSYQFTRQNLFSRRDSTQVCPSNTTFGLYGNATWTIDSSFSTMTINSFPNYLYRLEITKLTRSNLELAHQMKDYFGKDVTFTYAFRSIP